MLLKLCLNEIKIVDEVNNNSNLVEPTKPYICSNNKMCYALIHIYPQMHCAISKLLFISGA